MPPLETLLDEDLADPAAAHGGALLAQVDDQTVQRPGRERQAQVRRRGQRGVDDRTPLLSGVGRRPPAAYVLLPPLQPARVEALGPVPHRGPAQVHAGADVRYFQALERMPDDSGPAHEAGACRPRSCHAPQLLPLLGAIVSSSSLLLANHPGRCQAETPPIDLSEFAEPALSAP